MNASSRTELVTGNNMPIALEWSQGKVWSTKVKVVPGVGIRFPSEVSTTADESAVADPESTSRK